jgi:hypothetical protein
MKGITYDCKTGKQETIDDGLPMPKPPPYVEPVGVDLIKVAEAIKKVDELDRRVKALEKTDVLRL